MGVWGGKRGGLDRNRGQASVGGGGSRRIKANIFVLYGKDTSHSQDPSSRPGLK